MDANQNRANSCFRHFVLVILLLESVLAGPVYANDHENPEVPLTGKYIGLGVMRDIPVGKAKEFFRGSQAVPNISYGFFRDHWLMHLQLVVKRLYLQESAMSHRISKRSDVPILSFAQTSEYSLRLHHPLYLGLGYGFSYLFPVEKIGLPSRKNPDFEAEVGVAGLASLTWLFKSKNVARLSASQWRGTKTRHLQGLAFEAVFERKL